MKFIRLKPVYEYPLWARNDLALIRNKKWDGEGATWDVAAHKDLNNEVLNPEYEGLSLRELVLKYPDELMKDAKMMLKAGYIDAGKPLSIQIHPNNEYALKNDNDLGKTESWYILKADEDASIIVGTSLNTKQEVKKHLEDNTIEDYLLSHKVSEGDFITLHPGTIHSLGKGILAFEVSTNSNVTYRFYDFNRVDANGNKRELHIDKSLDVLRFDNEIKIIHTKDMNEQCVVLDDNDFYRVVLINVDGEYYYDLNDRYVIITNVKGQLNVKASDEETTLSLSENLLVPADKKQISIVGKGKVLLSISKV